MVSNIVEVQSVDRHDDCDDDDNQLVMFGQYNLVQLNDDGDIHNEFNELVVRSPIVEPKHHSNPECNFLESILH